MNTMTHMTCVDGRPAAAKRRRSLASGRRSLAGSAGYILLEVMLALSIFAIAVLGLARALNTTLEAGNIMNKDTAVRLGLRSFIEEQKRKAVSDMATTTTDDRLQTTYTSTVEPLSITIARTGQALTDCYRVTFTASYMAGPEQRNESVELWFYQSQAEQDKRRQR